MDIVKACSDSIDEKLKELDLEIEKNSQSYDNEFQQTQTLIHSVFAEKDKNLDRILDHQTYVKMIIEADGQIKFLKQYIAETGRSIAVIRKECAKIALDSLKEGQELMETHAGEIERFQLGQMKSIALDHQRLKGILEQRKREIISLKKETENEEKNRESFLADVEKNLEQQLQNRNKANK